MPKSHHPKLGIHLDLLRPQSNPEKLPVMLIHWLLSSGRYIFIFVEAVVLIAFAARFKLDADLAANKETIEEQIPYIESLKPTEILIRQTQFKLSTIDSIFATYADYGQILKKIADQTPSGVRIISLNLERNVAQLTIHLNGQAQNNSDLATFLGGLKGDPVFTEVTISSISFEKGTVNFSLNFNAKLTSLGGKSS